MIFYYEPENILELSEIIVKLVEDENYRTSKNVNADNFFNKYNFKTQYKKYTDLISFLAEN